MKISCHPDNVELLKKAIENGKFSKENINPVDPFMWFEIVQNSFLDRERHSGKYVLQDGSIVGKESVRVDCGLYSYGPDDIDFLLLSGKIRKHMEALFVVMNDWMFKWPFNMPIVPTNPSFIPTSGF